MLRNDETWWKFEITDGILGGKYSSQQGTYSDITIEEFVWWWELG